MKLELEFLRSLHNCNLIRCEMFFSLLMASMPLARDATVEVKSETSGKTEKINESEEYHVS